MSLLAVDVRNDQTTIALLHGDEVQHCWRVGTVPERTADEWSVLMTGLLASADVEGVDGVVLSSTVPAVLHELRLTLGRSFDAVDVVILGPGVRTGLPVLMDNPREVGTDRVANAVAAADLVGGPCVVVDVAFATTFDVINEEAAYVDGAIAPGVGSSLAALGRAGAQLRQVELERPRSVVARNTIEALQAGAVFGFAGQIDGIVTRMCAELGGRPGDIAVVATGDPDGVVLAECATVTRRIPELTLLGLRRIYERNQR